MGIEEMRDALPSPEDPDAALGAVVALRRLADWLEATAVGAALDQGWTWQQIAQSLGVSRQAVHKKHARRRPRRKGEK